MVASGIAAPLVAIAEIVHQHVRQSSKLALAAPLQAARLTAKQQLNDTTRRISRIVGTALDASSDVLTIRLELAESQSWMEISLYNMLGKRVREIYRGPAQADDASRDYSATVGDLPNGLYIVSVQGPTVRLADKVFISR
jgi:hypothetical protein